MSGGVLLYGDPHGEWRPLVVACRDERPDAVVLLGDCDLEAPLHRKLPSVFGEGIPVFWIPGNHDVDLPEFHDHLWDDHPEGNLHGRWRQIGGLIVAGLGGVFSSRIWYPRHDDATPLIPSRRAYVKGLRRAERWRGGLPLSRRATVFPEDADALRKLRIDVLVTHEAPSTHRHGFVGLDRVAADCRAKLVVHGHHHQSYEAKLPDGPPVRGLSKAEVFRLRREHLT